MIEPLVRSILVGDAAVSAIVGGKITADIIEEDDNYPAITWKVISDPGDYDYEGDTGFRRTRIQLDLWCIDPEQRTTLYEAVRAALSGHKDENIHLIQLENSRSSFEKDEKQDAIYRWSCDLICTY